MIKGSLILCDSNICIYRTLSLIEPKILGADHLDKTTKIIADLTNNNLACKIIVMDVVNSEVQSDEILFECINDFCTNKLHWRPNSFKIQQVFIKARKSIHKFLDNRLVSGEILGKIRKFRRQLTKVDSFYLTLAEILRIYSEVYFSEDFRGSHKTINKPWLLNQG